MSLRTHRLRTVAVAAALGVGTVGGAVGVAAGIAGAALAHSTTTNVITAATAPRVAVTGSNQVGGDLRLTLQTATTALTGSVVHLHVTAATRGTVTWQSETVTGTTLVAAAAAGNGTATLAISVTEAAHTTGTVAISAVRYITKTALGTVHVTPTWQTTAGATAGTFTAAHKTAVNAYATQVSPPPAPAETLAAGTNPPVAKGARNQAAGDWTLRLAGTAGQGWAATQRILVTVAPPTGTNCSGANFALFTGTPAASVTASSTVGSTPAFTVRTLDVAPCGTTQGNELVLTFTNSGTFTGTGSVTITISGVRYRVGKTTATGTIAATLTKTTGTTATAGAQDDAHVATLYVTGNNPAVTVPVSAFDAAISPVDVVENTAGTLAAGYVCVSLTSAANAFNASAAATASATAGTGKATATVAYEAATGGKVTSGAAPYAVFRVTQASASSATTYSVSGLAVNASGTPGPVKAKVTEDTTSADCATPASTLGTTVAYTVGTKSTQVYGATADATAAAEFERAFPSGTGTCPASRAAVVATTAVFQDALSSQYLAGHLDTGTLLTPTTTLSQATITAIRREGISSVYIVGGPLAVSTAVSSAISALPVYQCGGSARTTVIRTGKMTVRRLYGQTQYGTALQVADFVGAGSALAFPGAYSTSAASATGGSGRYNDTAGTASRAPVLSGSLPTAILASGLEFQDAQAASVISYHDHVPLLLTPATTLSTTAVAAIENLGIKQVVLMGGPLAVTNTVEATLVAKTGVSVVRVAGKDYTDTARELARFEAATASNGLGWTPNGRILVARGNGFTDGLAGAVLESTTNTQTGAPASPHPLLLTETPTVVGPYLTTFLKVTGHDGIDGTTARAGHTITGITVLGGPLAVSTSAVTAMQTDLKH